MHHPKYAWMFFNWYSNNWWFYEGSSCSTQAEYLETVIETSIIFDHYPRIEEHRKNDSNVGNIVSIYLIYGAKYW